DCRTEQYRLIYLYDSDGSPIGMQYREPSMAEGSFYTFWFEKNLQGDIVAVYNETGTKLISYAYDAWGNFRTTTHNRSGTNAYAAYNPFRYRGYYYDDFYGCFDQIGREIGFYYLNSRYYNPEWGRFINADGYVSTGTGLLGYNMYAYCNNNPVMYVDPDGNWPSWSQVLTGVAIVAGVVAVAALCVATAGIGVAAVAGTAAVVSMATSTAVTATSVALTAATVMVASYVAAGVAAMVEDDEIATPKEIAITDSKSNRQQAYFPENPYTFSPQGLVFIERSGTKNGKILQWVDPASGCPVFEWDEDLRKGAHYHAMLPEWQGQHRGPHYNAGTPVPEPWNSIYFGG
ncbi:MAG: RHS repeat-associated core domain-containing protein, partial [Clostridia bacterium]|nr:RHS repeat-associated core domain-containing protein [Clostridia bacterium]